MEMINTSNRTIRLTIEESNQVGEARRFAIDMGRVHGLTPDEVNNASLLATEAANNLVKHAGGGELILHCLQNGDAIAFEILSLDKGPGMPDVDRCMEDGYSTAGSPGNGLGAMARLSTSFDIYSRPRHGTAILMRIQTGGDRKRNESRFETGGVSVPTPRENLCGDSWATAEIDGRLTAIVSDGLGHGQFAWEASAEAILAFRENPNLPLVQLIEIAHDALRKTRGAAVAVARIDPGERTVRFAGIGNIAGIVLGGASTRNMISYNGIVGHQMRKVQEMSYPWPEDGILLMHSDGIQTRWNLDQLPGLTRRHPTLIAGAIYRDFKRPNDDATVVAARIST